MYSKSNNLNLNTITTSGNTSIGIYSGDNLTVVEGNTITTTGVWGDGIYINFASNNNFSGSSICSNISIAVTTSKELSSNGNL